jgi:RmuC family
MVQSLDSERLVDALSREVGQFEEKVATLEEKCSHIRDCIAALSHALKQSRKCLSLSGKEPEALSPAGIAEVCGIRDHVELIQAIDEPVGLTNLVVREPGERTVIFVDGQLSGCRLDGPRLLEAARRRLPRLAAMAWAEGEGTEVTRVLFVPMEISAGIEGHGLLLEEAEGLGITVASPAALASILGRIALRWVTYACGQNARAVVDRGQDLVDVVSAFIADFTETEKLLCDLVNDCALASRRREQTGAPLHA